MESINISNPSEKINDLTIGIDFGTTNSVITYVKDKKITIIPDGDANIIPSIVAIAKKNNDIFVGQKAKINNSADFVLISSIKRLICKQFDEIDVHHFDYNIVKDDNGYPIIPIGNINYSVNDIVSIILAHLRNLACDFFQTNITKCTITVPANFDDVQRQVIKSISKNIGFNEIKILNEPTAAALAYGLDQSTEGIYGIYDLGGGTFDVSILKMKGGIFQVLSTAGDSYLGGDDIDRSIAHSIAHNLKIDYHENKKYLLMQAKKIKHMLSIEEKVELDDNITFSRGSLESIAINVIEKTFAKLQYAIADSGNDLQDIKGIVLVGGSTKMPMVKNFLSKKLNIPILDNINPDEVVSIGAGIHAAGKNAGFDNLLLDVVPLSLGIEVMGGLVEKIIYRNTPIPASVVQEFTTYIDNQEGIVINIVQGEREFVKDCRSIGSFILTGIPKVVAGLPKILVSFFVDDNGILSVSAKDKLTGAERVVQMKPTYGLSTKNIVDEILSAEDNMLEDLRKKQHTQVIVSTKQFLYNLKNAIQEDVELLDEDEMKAINIKIIELDNLIFVENPDIPSIKIRLIALQEYLEEFIEKRINKHMSQIIDGRNVNELQNILKSIR